jgi:DNA-binding NarL/FixJ family response regulator
MIKVLLAEDNALCRAGLRAMVDAMPDVDVVSEVGDGPAALRAIEELKPDVALLDVTTPGLDSLEVARRVSREPSRTRTILLSTDCGGDGVQRARAGGAAGCLPSTASRTELERAVREVADGKTWLDPEGSRRRTARREPSGPPPSVAPRPLTPRLKEILQLLVEGLSSKEIASRLDLSTRTVEKHRGTLMERTGIHTVAGLVRYAMRAGLVRSAS